MIVFGIKTCDTVKKAIKALEGAGHPVRFRDIRVEPLTPAEIEEFSTAFGEKLINRASTTWRGLSEAERAMAPEALLAAHPALMKRPVIRGTVLTIGWDKAAQAAHL